MNLQTNFQFKFDRNLIQLSSKLHWSDRYEFFAQGTTAAELHWNQFSIEFEQQWKNHLRNRPQVLVSSQEPGSEWFHRYSDIKISVMTSQITSLMIVYSKVYSGAYQRKHHSSVSLAFVREIHQWSVNSLHKGPVMRKRFPFDDVIMTDSPSFMLIQHIDAETKWPPISWQYFQIKFLQWKCMNFDYNFIEVYSQGSH